MEIIGNCLVGGQKLLNLYSYINQHASLEKDEHEALCQLLQQLTTTGNTAEASKLLSTLLSTSFVFNNVDPDVYQKLLDNGEFGVMQKIFHFQLKNGVAPRHTFMSMIVEYLCSKENLHSVAGFVELIKDYPTTEIWKPLVEGLLRTESYDTCSSVLLTMPLSTTTLRNCWEEFLTELAKKSQVDTAIQALDKLHTKGAVAPEQLAKLLEHLVRVLIQTNAPITDQLKCIKFANANAQLDESVLEEAFAKIATANGNEEKAFISAVLQANKIMTARVLNNLNTKLIEMGKENVALSLFNLGLNSAFEKIKEEEITMPSKQMKRLVVLQQKKILTLQKELNNAQIQTKVEEKPKVKEEKKKDVVKETEKAKEVVKKTEKVEEKPKLEVKKMPEKEESSDSDWDDYVLV